MFIYVFVMQDSWQNHCFCSDKWSILWRSLHWVGCWHKPTFPPWWCCDIIKWAGAAAGKVLCNTRSLDSSLNPPFFLEVLGSVCECLSSSFPATRLCFSRQKKDLRAPVEKWDGLAGESAWTWTPAAHRGTAFVAMKYQFAWHSLWPAPMCIPHWVTV